MSEPVHVLVVDDEPRIRTMLRRYLLDDGFKVTDAAGGAAMRGVLERDAIDLVLLDLMMPGEDGLALARDLRQRSEIPIIMLTGKGDVIDRVVGLYAGADDYITKPFELREVVARIRAVMRRRRPRSTLATSERVPTADSTVNEILAFKDWQLDVTARELRRSTGDLVHLTVGEFELLWVFARHPNRVLSRNRLVELVKGRERDAFDRAIDVQVGRLRKKLEPDPGKPTLLKTVWGGGYVLVTGSATHG